MPRTKRRFADDDPSSGDEQQEQQQVQYGARGGKHLRLLASGKQLMRRPSDDDDMEDDSSEDDAANPTSNTNFRGASGKQLLRVADPDSEGNEEDEPFQPVARSGGKSLMMRPPQSEDDDDEDEDEDEPFQSVSRGGGKSLMRMRPTEEAAESDHEEEEDDQPVQPVERGGGKSLMGMRGGGKQLRPPPPQSEEDESEEEATPLVVERAQGAVKQLRRPAAAPPNSESDEDDDDMDMDDESEEDEEVVKKPAKQTAQPPPVRGKTLRRAPPEKKTRPPPRKASAKKAQEPEDMEESDEESSEEELELDFETFDTQKLVQGDEDQKTLDALPEIEREAILGERFDKLKADQDMRKALRESKRKEREAREAQKTPTSKKPAKKAALKKSSKATDGDAELAAKLSAARESTRDRDATGIKAKKTSALAQLREDKKFQQKDEESEEESDIDFGSDEDSDEDYEEAAVSKPWQQAKRAKKATRTSSRLDRYEDDEGRDEEMEDVSERAPVVEATLEDYIKVTLPRRRLARWCHEPFFDQAVIGCFVRIFIGEGDDGTKFYRLCRIVDVEKSKSEYKFPATNSRDKPITSSKFLKLVFGKNEKVFPMYLASDSRPNEEDVRKYVTAQKSSRQEALGKREAAKLRKKQDELVNNYTYTQADIDKHIAERKKAGKALANLGLEQTRVAIAVQAAQSVLEDAKRRLENAKRAHLEAPDHESDELKKALEDAQAAATEAKADLEEKEEEERLILAVVEKRKKKLTKRRKDQNWSKVNERAAMMNRNADFDSYKAQQARLEAEAKSGSKPRFNPYARRRVKPKILWEVGQKEEKKDDDATQGADSEMREDVGTNDASNSGKDDQAYAAQQDAVPKSAFMGQRHQFSIDEEALAPDATSVLRTTRKRHDGTRVRKGLSLAQYHERKNAGTL